MRRVGVLTLGAETDDMPLLKVFREDKEARLDRRRQSGARYSLWRRRQIARALMRPSWRELTTGCGYAISRHSGADAAQQQNEDHSDRTAFRRYPAERGVVQNRCATRGRLSPAFTHLVQLTGRPVARTAPGGGAGQLTRIAYASPRRPSDYYGRYIEAAAPNLGVKIETIQINNAHAEIKVAIRKVQRRAE